MSTIIGATKKQGSLIIEVCPGSGKDCPTNLVRTDPKTFGDHPSKISGTSGREQDNNLETHYDVAAHAVVPFRLTDGAYDLNEDRAAESALKQADDAIEERYGQGEAHSGLVGRSSAT